MAIIKVEKKQGEIEKVGIWKVNMTDRKKLKGSKMSECIKMEDKKNKNQKKQNR